MHVPTHHVLALTNYMNLTLKRKIVLAAILQFGILLTTVILWEQARDNFFTVFDNSVEVTREERVEFTLDALIADRANSWLKGPEALEYAKEQVTSEVIKELSKE